MLDRYTGRVPRTDQAGFHVEACNENASADPWISVIVTGDDECTINVVQDSNAATVRYKSIFSAVKIDLQTQPSSISDLFSPIF